MRISTPIERVVKKIDLHYLLTDSRSSRYLSENCFSGVCGGFAAAHTTEENLFSDGFLILA